MEAVCSKEEGRQRELRIRCDIFTETSWLTFERKGACICAGYLMRDLQYTADLSFVILITSHATVTEIVSEVSR